ncbi:hypothetical protein L5515_005929 [Caenorhabditis briggsae]|uniref:Uncharacterized protein n=1 Tax=Caenorhabditis briggsae TaxID=6238 RepID=A0AAE9F037_CAEBR|nr:hypothetical protein L5515_005929 [Caenorhabditis briggsae]
MPINLLKLPRLVGVLGVTELEEYQEVFLLSLCSRRTKCLVEKARIKLPNVSFRSRECHGYNEFMIGIDLRCQKYGKFLHRLECACEPMGIQKALQEYINSIFHYSGTNKLYILMKSLIRQAIEFEEYDANEPEKRPAHYDVATPIMPMGNEALSQNEEFLELKRITDGKRAFVKFIHGRFHFFVPKISLDASNDDDDVVIMEL